MLLTELHYQPCISFFRNAAQAGRLLLEAHENYQKQSYRNRCRILTANGLNTLVVPVKHTSAKIPIRQVQPDYSQRWADNHWRSIRSAYGSAPYFLYYSDPVMDIYQSRPEFLFDLNLSLLKLYFRLLNLNIDISFTVDFQTIYPPPVVDTRNLVHPKRPPDNLSMQPYVQVFGRQFAPDLAILDLLFNLGPEAGDYLRPT